VDLTARQREVLDVIRDSVRAQGYPPSVREIATAVGLSSPATVQNHLTALEEKGYIRRGPSKRRALEVLSRVDRESPPPTTAGYRSVPLVGAVAAGRPLLAEENIEEFLPVPEWLTPSDESFALRVRGDSMVKAGILDGDVVIVRRQEDAENGDIVVAHLGDEATLKRFFREEGHVRLQPENDSMEPILTRDPRIAGKVTGVLRRLR
jgi:repressor LexA